MRNILNTRFSSLRTVPRAKKYRIVRHLRDLRPVPLRARHVGTINTCRFRSAISESGRARRANIRKIDTITSSGSNLRTRARLIHDFSERPSFFDPRRTHRSTGCFDQQRIRYALVSYISRSRVYPPAKAEYTRPGQVGIKGSQGGPIRHDTLLNARCRERASEAKLYLRHVRLDKRRAFQTLKFTSIVLADRGRSVLR